jgi:hypothetical protein
MPARLPIQAGDWFARKKDRRVLRRVIFQYEGTCSYREFATWEGGYTTEGGCKAASLRQWGERISEHEARRLIPDLDERDRERDLGSRAFTEWVRETSLRSISDDKLLAEARRRGLVP